MVTTTVEATCEPGLKSGQLGTLHVWALGVGIVVCGQYFGWNLGLKENGPVAMLAASLLVCVLFLAWALTLSELTVAMPSAGGPLEHGLRTGGPWLGFLMGWSMLLECFFGGIATALAGGGYVAFLLEPEHPDGTVTVTAGLLIVATFFLLQAWGVREQAWALVLMTFGALVALAGFWVAAATNFSWERAWTSPVLPAARGWSAIPHAIPFALWWLIIIEGAALAAEESRRPDRIIPRGLTAAVLTTAVLLVLTLGTACGALDAAEIATRNNKDVIYPLAEVIRRIPAGRSPLLLYGFGTVALLGLVASYHGLLYGTSRQLFALGRAGFVPAWLGQVHATRQTPVPALAVGSLLTAGFVIANLWIEQVAVAVLAAGFAALVLYILSMICLVLLRRRQPGMFHAYRAPLPRLLPVTVVVLSVLALLVYPNLGLSVTLTALVSYAVGVGYFALRQRTAPLPADPDTPQHQPPAYPATKAPASWVDGVAALLLIVALVVSVGLGVTVFVGDIPHLLSPDTDMVLLLALLVAALGMLTLLSLRRRRGNRGGDA